MILIHERNAVGYDLLVELHGQSIFVDGDLLDVVSGLNLQFVRLRVAGS